jgi:DNA-binding YbaB/EbfC family protein
MNIQKLMRQAQQMQDKMQRELAELEIESSVGGGMVTLRMSGHKQLISVQIDPEVMDPEDPGMLQDLVVAAVNDAGRKVDEAMREKMGGMGMGIPGLS